jgi:putative ABC transport system permease protein
MQQLSWGGGAIAIRTSGTPESVTGSLRAAVTELDPTQPVHRIRNANSLIQDGLGSISLLGSLLAAFAALGLLLAAIGIYGVTSYSVVQRTSEIGIRMALGAQRKDVLWLVLGRGGRLVTLGAALGLGGAYAVSRLLISIIPTLPTRDPATLVVVSAVLFVIALLACYIPARRATRVDPMVALRYE